MSQIIDKSNSLSVGNVQPVEVKYCSLLCDISLNEMTFFYSLVKHHFIYLLNIYFYEYRSDKATLQKIKYSRSYKIIDHFVLTIHENNASQKSSVNYTCS